MSSASSLNLPFNFYFITDVADPAFAYTQVRSATAFPIVLNLMMSQAAISSVQKVVCAKVWPIFVGPFGKQRITLASGRFVEYIVTFGLLRNHTLLDFHKHDFS